MNKLIENSTTNKTRDREGKTNLVCEVVGAIAVILVPLMAVTLLMMYLEKLGVTGGVVLVVG